MIIKTIRNLQEIETVRACWEAWQNHPNSDYEHFNLICRLRQDLVRPLVLSVECDGQPLALLVARLERRRLAPAIGYFKPIKISTKIITVLYQGMLGSMDKNIGEVLVEHVRTLLVTGDADMVVFNNLSEDSPLLQALAVHDSKWYYEKKPNLSVHWEMAIPEGRQFLQQKVRSKHRNWIRKKQSELESTFASKISWRWISVFQDISHLCAQLENVAVRTYQRSLGVGFKDDEEHRQRFALFAKRGQLRVQLLEIDGNVQAYWIGTIIRGVFYSSETGYNPDLRRYEVGTLVFIQMMEELIKERVQKFDFGLGDALYKQRFGDKSWREATVRLFAPTVKGLALRSCLELFGKLDAFGRRLLQRADILERVKTGWRRRIALTGDKIENG